MHFALHSECVPNAFATVKPFISDNISSLATVIPSHEGVKLCRQLCRQLKHSVNYRLMVLILGPNVSRLIPHGFAHISRSSRVILSPVHVAAIRIELTIFGVTQHCYAVILKTATRNLVPHLRPTNLLKPLEV